MHGFDYSEADELMGGRVVARTIAGRRIVALRGDIISQETDAIVNAANPSLCGGGGVDGAIHRAGGPTILAECQAYVHRYGMLTPGMAMSTSGGALRARWVIHTVGPIYRSDGESEPVLASAYQESLRLADRLELVSISFPAISAGAYGYPLNKAARVAVATICRYLAGDTSLELVQLVCFSEDAYAVYKNHLEGFPKRDM